MFSLTTGQIEAWLAQFFWPFVRIGACLMVAPIFGAGFVPARVRVVLAAAITLLVAPLLVPPADVAVFSGMGFVITAQQIVIGLALGFAMQIVFDAIAMGAQLLANTMGLSFAMTVDPLRGVSTPVLGQFYTIVVTLTFLALNGHLALLQTLVDGFQTLPVNATGLGSGGLWMMVLWGGHLFSGALTVALPGLTALLIVNMGFGVMSRAAPTLNFLAVGFPITLILGLVIVLGGMPAVQTVFVSAMQSCLELLANLQGGA